MSKLNYPEWPNNIGKRGRFKKPNGAMGYFTIEDEIRYEASIGPGDKLFYLQKLNHDNGNIEFRFCYFIIGKEGRMEGKWTFGQFAPFIPAEDLRAIVDQAKQKGWI